MRIHLGHHFYGAGNLGDDFMLAGFLAAMGGIAPDATYTCAVPFAREPLAARFPGVTWLPYEDRERQEAIEAADVWLGLGGSPFQHALSRWFVDHLLTEAAWCRAAAKPMYYLGVGVQGAEEVASADVARLCAQARGIWTRDPASAGHLGAPSSGTPVAAGADLAHVLFRQTPPPPAEVGTATLVANFDYQGWPGQEACLAAVDALRPRRRVWLAQETRELPGAERALHAALPPGPRQAWELVAPDEAGPIGPALGRWPSGEWLVTARYHAALAGSWSGSKVVVIATNRKLEAAARELGCPCVRPAASGKEVSDALAQARPATHGPTQAERAEAACREWAKAAGLMAG